MITGRQLRESLRKWQSPSDPSTNHNIACNRQHVGTAEWFCEGDIFELWKVTGSLLWIHGKRMHAPLSLDGIDDLMGHLLCSGLWKERSMVCRSLIHAVTGNL
jgi:hypothetical protein